MIFTTTPVVMPDNTLSEFGSALSTVWSYIGQIGINIIWIGCAALIITALIKLFK